MQNKDKKPLANRERAALLDQLDSIHDLLDSPEEKPATHALPDPFEDIPLLLGDDEHLDEEDDAVPLLDMDALESDPLESSDASPAKAHPPDSVKAHPMSQEVQQPLPLDSDDSHLISGTEKTAAAPQTGSPSGLEENPFLSSRTRDQLAENRERIQQDLRDLIASRKPPSNSSAPPEKPEPPPLDEIQVRQIVDEVLSAWLPKIERELRDRLSQIARDEANPDKG